ncbi:MAG: type VI secretion system ATPase TssH, partial [Acidobacteriota bacterium]|nr:type VI secretion system ATPase TssH [Acidobacteriota bacterium]
MFRFDKLTQKAQEAVQQAQELAGKSQNQAVHPIHLLLALVNQRDGIVRPVLEKCGVQPDAVMHEAERLVQSIPKVIGQQSGMYLSPPLNQVFEAAFQEAERFKDEFGSAEHLLLAISDQKYDPAGSLLEKSGATHDAILKSLVAVRGTQRITDQNPESKYQALERYAVDMTE